MSLALRRRAELSPEELAKLDGELAAFYTKPLAGYYQRADEAAQHYNPKEQPFHCDLAGRVFPGASVLEFGCGTAHLCPRVEERGGRYTGIDFNQQLLEDNRRRFPQGRFFQIGTPIAETFDLVASLYTIEHVVDPPAYLERMWRYCRPGGLVAVICPDFIESPTLPPSFFYGRTPRRLREKLQTFSLLDAGSHWLDLKVRGPAWKQRAQESPPGAFWINLRPSILHGADYSIDADAVHLPRLKDLVWFFEQKGAAVLQTSAKMPGIAADILRFNCYVLAQKPALANGATGQNDNLRNP
jgi:SAM-dependent methyltransferase